MFFLKFLLEEFDQFNFHFLVDIVSCDCPVDSLVNLASLVTDVLVLVLHLLLDGLHIVFDVVDVVNTGLSSRILDIVKYLLYLDIFFLEIIHLHGQLLVLAVEL